MRAAVYSLAIVLALAMVLCMIPASFADTVFTGNMNVVGTSYTITVYSWEHDQNSAVVLDKLNEKSGVTSITAEYNYENQDEDFTGKFTEDTKMAIVKVKGFNEAFAGGAGKEVTNREITVDGKNLEANELAE